MKIRVWTLSLASLALLTLAACDGEQTQYQQEQEGCQGQSLQVEQDSYCIYEGSVIVEEGFQCPPDTPFLHQDSGLGICSGSADEPAERLREVVDRFEGDGDNNGNNGDNNNIQADFPELGASCAEPAPLSVNVEPLEPRELFIVLFLEGADVQQQAQALSAHYGFEVEQVFEIIPAFAAELSQEEVAALRCYKPVQSIEQSRSDTPPPGGVEVSSVAEACVEVEAGFESSLQVLDLGAGSVSVLHMVYEGNCCTGHVPTASANFETRGLSVTYSEGDMEPCDCTCTFELSYTVSGLSDGLWTVSADGLSQEVLVSVE